MVAASSYSTTRRESRALSGDARLILHGVPWKTYILLNDALELPGLKLSYHRGALEIMTKGGLHEIWKKNVARLLEMWALEVLVPIYGYGEMTLRNELEKAGIEPDECYAVGRPKPIPDLAIEVVVTSGGLNKLPIYRGIGVREVWFFEDGELTMHRLGTKGYARATRSALLPDLDLAALARHAMMKDQHRAVLAFRDKLRAAKPRRRRRAARQR